MNTAVAVVLLLAVIAVIFGGELMMKKAGIKPAKKDNKKFDKKREKF
jgi:hypothetical protein